MQRLDSGKLPANSGCLYECHQASSTLAIEYQADGLGFIAPLLDHDSPRRCWIREQRPHTREHPNLPASWPPYPPLYRRGN